MHRFLLPLVLLCARSLHAQEIRIDWRKARAPHRREKGGQEKFGRQLLDFFTKNPYAQPWFVQRS